MRLSKNIRIAGARAFGPAVKKYMKMLQAECGYICKPPKNKELHDRINERAKRLEK